VAPSTVPAKFARSALRNVSAALLLLVIALGTLWAAAAIFFDLPGPAALRYTLAAIYLAGVVAALIITGITTRAVTSWLGAWLLIFSWWLTLKPTNERDWQSDVARVAWAEMDGTRATIHNIRNFSYFSERDFVPEWQVATVDIAAITGVDLFVSHWGSPWIAHGIVSFAFADGTYLAASVEARKSVGQEYSAVRGFFRQYEVIYLLAQEQDVVALRALHRRETVYLYHTRTTPTDAQNLFRHYLDQMNQARYQPEWYNALDRNCITDFVSYLVKAKVGGISRWDWRILADGRGDEMLYDLGDLVGNLPFQELKQRARINDAAKNGGASPDFSRRIRQQRPGFE